MLRRNIGVTHFRRFFVGTTKDFFQARAGKNLLASTRDLREFINASAQVGQKLRLIDLKLIENARDDTLRLLEEFSQ
ncbi:hypothetical protein D3C87_1781180 [compost metagenome]